MAVGRYKGSDAFPGKAVSAKLVCLHGENDGLIRERAAALRAVFAAAGSAPAVVDLDSDQLAREPFALADEIGAPSLFANRRLVRVALGARGVKDAFANALPALSTAQDVLVVVDAGSDKRQEELVQLLSKDPSSLVIACPADRADDLVGHARAVLAEAGIALDDASARELVALADGDRGLLANELVKLAFLCERGTTLDSAALRDAVADAQGVFLDEAADRVLDGDVAAAFAATERLAASGGDAVQLVGATLRKALWAHRNASGAKAANLRRAIDRLNASIRTSRSTSKLAAAQADFTLIRAAHFLRR